MGKDHLGWEFLSSGIAIFCASFIMFLSEKKDVLLAGNVSACGLWGYQIESFSQRANPLQPRRAPVNLLGPGRCDTEPLS